MKTELERFYSLIDDIKVAMMITRRPDGHLESRPMANQKQADGADLWFVTAEGTAKLRDIQHDPHVNLAYYKDGSSQWVSVSGIAKLSRDRAKIIELYAPDWKAWFGQDGNSRDGTPGRPARRAHRRRCARGGIPGRQQAQASHPVRTRKGLADRRTRGVR